MSPELLVGVLSLIAAVLALPKIGIRRFFLWAAVTVIGVLVWSQIRPEPSNAEPQPMESSQVLRPSSGTLPSRSTHSGTTPPSQERSQPPIAPIVMPETYRSDELPSGHCKDFSGWYSLCSADKPEGWTIVSQVFQLTEDRSCSGWA